MHFSTLLIAVSSHFLKAEGTVISMLSLRNGLSLLFAVFRVLSKSVVKCLCQAVWY